MPRLTKDFDLEQMIGKHLRKARKRRGLSGMELAVLMGVSFQQVHKYERGENRVTVSYLLLLSDTLKISASKLFMEIYGAHRAAGAVVDDADKDASGGDKRQSPI